MLSFLDEYARRVSRIALIAIAGSVLVVSMLPATLGSRGIVHATGQTCQVTSLSPHTATSGSETGFAFTITSDAQVSWARIISPSSSLVINGGSSDWLPTVTYSSSQATFTGSPIDAGNPISVQVDAAVSNFPSSYWVVQTAIDSGGTDRVSCSGDTSVSVSDTGPPVISSISATASTTSAVITWTTDKAADSQVDYGTTTSYGPQVYNGTLTTSHSVTLSSLTPNTTYHYQVTSSDSSAQSVSSNDGTFKTAAVSSGGSGGGTGGGSSSSGGGSGSPIGSGGNTTPSDKTPPTISITSSVPRVTAATPTVQGVADDNISVRKVEYSTDGGKDWLSVDHTTGLGSTHVTFSFTPLNLEDNTYIFMARAIDGGGNIKATKGITVVIDRLPPAVGGSIIAVGAQVLEPDDKGVITTLSGVDLTVTMSTSGGASSVVVSALDVDHDNHVAASFTLTRDAESGLWNGTLSFSEPGHYQLVAHAVDGANNSDTRTVVTVSVTRPALVLSSKGPVANATATVYYLDPDTDSWIVWDGQAYGQTNPQQTDTNGAFAFMLPAGKYYVHIAAKGYLPLNSMSFVVSQPRPLASAFHLQSRDLLHSILLPVSGFIAAPLTSNLGASNVPASFTKQPMTGKVFPSFVLDDTGGQRQNSVSWLGKPTIVTVMSTWSPTAAEEIAALDTLASNQDINVRVIGMQENIAKLQAYSSISGTELHWLADPNGSLASKLHVGTLPAHYIVDRNGVIQQVINGTESAQQLLDALTEAQ